MSIFSKRRNILGGGLRLTDGGGLETAGTGAFSTVKKGNGATRQGSDGNDMDISFSANEGQTDDNPMAGHANGEDNEIRPYTIYALPLISY